MRTKGIVLITVLAVLALVPSQALSWCNAAHVYIDDRLGMRWGLGNVNEIYGGLAPDILGFVFEYPELDALMHYKAQKVWNAAHGGAEKAAAFGFVSHNEVWGADFTAHVKGLTFGHGQGYIIAKAKQLCHLSGLSKYLGISPQDARQVCHIITEAGVDLLVKEYLDEMVGWRMTASAEHRSDKFPGLLVRAYTEDVAGILGTDALTAAWFIIAAEQELRETLMLYGQAISQDTGTAALMLAEQMVALAGAFLPGVTLPEDIEYVVADLILFSMDLCSGDFQNELEQTVSFVKNQLIMRGFTY